MSTNIATESYKMSIIGIGDQGMASLTPEAQQVLATATAFVGGKRHLAMLPENDSRPRYPWPSPFALPVDVQQHPGLCILASGDPSWYGVLKMVTRTVPAAAIKVVPAVSSLSLAAARMGWPIEQVRTVSIHGRPLSRIWPLLAPRVRFLALTNDGDTPHLVAKALADHGWGDVRLTILGHLGNHTESQYTGLAQDIAAGIGNVTFPDLNVLAVECPDITACPPDFAGQGAGLPDACFVHDGKMTKQHVRAATLAALRPFAGAVLWDIGAGSGSIGIEWLRLAPYGAAYAIEHQEKRLDMVRTNAANLGVEHIHVIAGQAPAACAGLPTPDAIFVGGGVTAPDMLSTCWQALPHNGVLVANVVTLEGQAAILRAHAAYGGQVTQIAVSHSVSVGEFTGLKPAMPVWQWRAVKP